ncbi:hypothetical protein [Gimesia fumaroli]|uniref:Uncharacterized protein n=1 Tax=Gimesia fumaroli TaxID=2527976 RepID=A0A518I9J2_9PLAN|nr:hypothetical protein [Gimesia fumaroli]QDV49778.1 hypothetical protein Enr17x_17990 [Gimesia fumaroli]
MGTHKSSDPQQAATANGTRSAFRLQTEKGKETFMFRSTKELNGYKILATDGECGTV